MKPDPKSTRINQKGFTLIELMMVVAIIGILASVALPAYQTYVAKTSITSIFASAASGKTPIFQYYIDNGEMPHATEMRSENTLLPFNAMMRSKLPGGNHTINYWRNHDTLTRFAIIFDGINGNVNGKRMWVYFEDDGSELVVKCVRQNTLEKKYLPKECHGNTHPR